MEQSHFQARRQKVFDLMVDNSIALLTASAMQTRNSDTEFPYRQDSYFYYLTGFEESFAIAALVKRQGQCKYILFCQDRAPEREQWTGAMTGLKGACEVFGADEAYSISEASLRFPELFAALPTVYHLMTLNPAFDKKLFYWINTLRKKARSGIVAPHRFIDLRVVLDEFRLFKEASDLSYIRKACEISVAAHVKAIQSCQVGMYEYELEGVLLHEFYRRGSRYPAYPCIVASGNNACTLHYTRNNAVIEDNSLVLIDAGAEYEYYASDITRTFPANGKFNKEQQAIYELVLAAQIAGIEHAKVDVAWDQIQQTILQILVAGLVELKILKGNVETLIAEKAYLPFYMHNSGHWMGLDVHDVGDYKVKGSWRKLAKGMVFTVEPGLYISAENHKVPEKWRGIGVRIEDDILITEKGSEVLTQGVPKTINEIEKLMKSQRVSSQ